MTTNPNAKDIVITVGEKRYLLKFGVNAAVMLEQKHDKTTGELLAEAGRLRFIAIRAVVWGMLQQYHAAEFITEEQAGTFIDQAGGIGPLTEAINQVIAQEAAPAGEPQSA